MQTLKDKRFAACPRCGYKADQESKFCPSCGSKFSAKSDDKASYWEPQRVKAFINSVASGIVLFLSALGLWYVSTSLEFSQNNPQRLGVLEFMFFGMIILSAAALLISMADVKVSKQTLKI